MINKQLLDPASIVVVGGSNNLRKPGGRIIQNILSGGYSGNLYVVNPKDELVQGIHSYAGIQELPPVDLAVLAISAKQCIEAVRMLAEQKSTRAFIILSAGFSEDSEEDVRLKMKLLILSTRREPV